MSDKQTAFFHLSMEEAIDAIRSIRNQILKDDVDSMNPMRWELLTDAEKNIWKEYRQNLLDITNYIPPHLIIEWPQHPNEQAVVETTTEGEGV